MPMPEFDVADYYEILKAAWNANSATIDPIFGDLAATIIRTTRNWRSRSARCDLEAHNTPADPQARAIRHRAQELFEPRRRGHPGRRPAVVPGQDNRYSNAHGAVVALCEVSAEYSRARDREILNSEQLFGLSCRQLLELHLWYLKEKG